MCKTPSANNSPTDNCVILGLRFSSGRLIVLVVTNSLIAEFSIRSTAGPERIGCVQAA